jgi:hypothetical protein
MWSFAKCYAEFVLLINKIILHMTFEEVAYFLDVWTKQNYKATNSSGSNVTTGP